ncbi:MAG TPA: DUF4202 domain-containing protein [Acidimicrobiales bacterium]|jgi:hypothetical protein|nr:DUF4202 domain-containing protein [Acidimicrobiales bacterium]
MPGDVTAAFAAIDQANADDPAGKELDHADKAVAWVRRLRGEGAGGADGAGVPEALLLAARAHHVRRWEIPRASYPEGRAGYLKWKRDLQQHHADVLAPLLRGAGYDADMVERVQAIVKKRGLAGASPDPDVQTLEDALCLVFLETQFAELAARLDDDKMVDILAKSLRKMSPDGRAAALEFEPGLSDHERSLLTAALERGL